jgi:Protein tyrosine and serine/threonine kinase
MSVFNNYSISPKADLQSLGSFTATMVVIGTIACALVILTNLGHISPSVAYISGFSAGTACLLIGVLIASIREKDNLLEETTNTSNEEPVANTNFEEVVEEPVVTNTNFEEPIEKTNFEEVEDARTIAGEQKVSVGCIWNKLDKSAKEDLLSFINKNKFGEGTKQINIEGKTIDFHYKFKASGTSADVYTIHVGEEKFALKILNSNKLGESAIQLQGKTIEGVVSIHAAEILNIDGEERAIIVMDALEQTWNEKYPVSTNANLNYIRQIIDSLILLKNEGFVHGSIHEQNIMFDEDGFVYIIDIDLLEPVSDNKYASNKSKNDMHNIKSILSNYLSTFLDDDHYLCKSAISLPTSTLEDFQSHYNSIFSYNKIIERYYYNSGPYYDLDIAHFELMRI